MSKYFTASELETPAFEFCKAACGLYEWTTDIYQAKARKAVEALIDYFDCHEGFRTAVSEMLETALEDARTGRGSAEVG